MAIKFTDRLKHAWNVFKSRDPTDYYPRVGYGGTSYRPDYNRKYYPAAADRSIVTAIKNRIAVDAAQVQLQHVRLDEDDRFLEVVDSGLNRCLSIEANIDQTGRAFRLDIFMSLLDEGVIAIVPIDTTFDPEVTGTYSITNMRVGKIVQWYPKHIGVEVYNEDTGQRQEIIVPKKVAAVVENPFYAVMNETNSTFQRLIHKLALLDAVDEQSSSGKLDLIIQLPYVVKTEQRKKLANDRRQEIEQQLAGSKYGIAYTDGTEKIQQLNRPLENNLLSQIQYLTNLAYSQLGMTAEIMDGTANEQAMLNYNNRIIEPLVAAVADSMKRTFLTKTAITQGQSIEYFRDPFALVPVDNVAEIADKFTRNEIMTSNEIRQAIGMRPSKDPNADQLRNKNLYDTSGPMPGGDTVIEEENVEVDDGPMTEEDYLNSIEDLDNLDAQLDDLEKSLSQSDFGGEALSHNYDPVYRKMYYEKYEKEGKTVGDSGSTTKGLNEEGRAYAKWLRSTLAEERKAKVAGSKASTDSKIEESKKRTDAGVETSKTRRDKFVSAFNEARDKRLESERNATTEAIDQSQRRRDTAVTRTNEQRDRDIESARSQTKSEIESHKNSIQMKIDTLKSQLASLSKEDRAAVKERVQQEIADLREDNRKKREDLQAAFKTTSGDIRSKAKAETDSAREEHRSTSASKRSKLKETTASVRSKAKENTDKVKQQHSDTSAKLRQEHKDASKILRDAHKAYSAEAKAYSDEVYRSELERIKSLPEFQAAGKSKKGKGSGPKATKGADGRMHFKG